MFNPDSRARFAPFCASDKASIKSSSAKSDPATVMLMPEGSSSLARLSLTAGVLPLRHFCAACSMSFRDAPLSLAASNSCCCCSLPLLIA